MGNEALVIADQMTASEMLCGRMPRCNDDGMARRSTYGFNEFASLAIPHLNPICVFWRLAHVRKMFSYRNEVKLVENPMRYAVLSAMIIAATPASADPVPAMVSTCFTPAQNCEPKIVAAIDGATSSIRVQAYGFTSLPIVHALQRAEARGVEVMAILDKVNARKYSGATLLVAAGIPVWIDDKPAIAHNKIIVIDDRLTIGGSFNYTASAERRNAENVTFIDSQAVAAEFKANWEGRLDASTPIDDGAGN